MRTPRSAPLLWLTCAAALAPASAHAGIEILFNDPQALHAGQYSDIQRVATAAGQDWLSRFVLPGASPMISVQISFAPIATANGRSATSSLVGTTAHGLRLFEQGAAVEVETGIDPNGAAADVEITLGNLGYLQQELWFDPDPVLRQAFVPLDRTDAVSVFLHEFGHAFGFNGWRDGSPLGPDLMNGLSFVRGARYDISELDLAILHDLGLPGLAAAAAVPEPGTPLLAISALVLMAGLRAAAKRQQTQQARTCQGQ